MNLKIAMSLVVALGALPAEAGGYRRAVCSPYVAQAVAVAQYATPVLAVAPPVYATVGATYQAEARDTAAFRQSAEYIEYQQLIGYRTAVERLTPVLDAGEYLEEPSEEPQGQPTEGEGQWGAPQAPEGPAPNYAPQAAAPQASRIPDCVAPVGQANGDDSDGGVRYHEPNETLPLPEATPQVPQAPQAPNGPVWDAEFSMKYPMLTATCMKCHTSSESKGGFDLSETIRQAKTNRDAETLNEVALTVLSGTMPPKSNLPYDVRSKLAEAIMTLPTE
jgi:hypothetical protein